MEIVAREGGEGDPGVEIQILSVFKRKVRVGGGLECAEEKVEISWAGYSSAGEAVPGWGLYGINRTLMMFAKFLHPKVD